MLHRETLGRGLCNKIKGYWGHKEIRKFLISLESSTAKMRHTASHWWPTGILVVLHKFIRRLALRKWDFETNSQWFCHVNWQPWFHPSTILSLSLTSRPPACSISVTSDTKSITHFSPAPPSPGSGKCLHHLLRQLQWSMNSFFHFYCPL